MNSRTAAQDRFLQCWGEMGNAWGINKTMAQIHALLMTSDQPLTMDEIMEELAISRGNVHLNLHQLMDWGLVVRCYVKGERKDYFQSEKGVWKMFCTIARERRRREIEPVVRGLEECLALAASEKNSDKLRKQIAELLELSKTIDLLMDQVSRQQDSKILPTLMKLVASTKSVKHRSQS